MVVSACYALCDICVECSIYVRGSGVHCVSYPTRLCAPCCTKFVLALWAFSIRSVCTVTVCVSQGPNDSQSDFVFLIPRNIK